MVYSHKCILCNWTLNYFNYGYYIVFKNIVIKNIQLQLKIWHFVVQWLFERNNYFQMCVFILLYFHFWVNNQFSFFYFFTNTFGNLTVQVIWKWKHISFLKILQICLNSDFVKYIKEMIKHADDFNE